MYPIIKFLLRDEVTRATAQFHIKMAPVDPKNPLLFALCEQPKSRTLDQNALMWAGLLGDIEEQVWIDGRKFDKKVWHEYFKQMFLPEINDPDLQLLVKNPSQWKKWDFLPDGRALCVGSTTGLTKYGFSMYLEQIHALCAQYGVRFSASPRAPGVDEWIF